MTGTVISDTLYLKCKGCSKRVFVPKEQRNGNQRGRRGPSEMEKTGYCMVCRRERGA